MPSDPAAPSPIARLPDEWRAEIARLGGRAFHAMQIFRWIHARGVVDPALMTDLPAALRAKLAEDGLTEQLTVSFERAAADRTRKLLVRMTDGAEVETVLIPRLPGKKGELPSPVPPESMDDLEDADAASAPDDDDDDERGDGGKTKALPVTQCISTQVGCAMGCSFCASGVAGLKRHMTPAEIVSQVLVGRSRLEGDEQLRNVVFMGMGEPLHNYEATARALRLLTHPDGISLSSRRVTVSTSGLVPEIARLGEDFGGKVALAISLHAPDDDTRSRLMPINRKYPLRELMAALRAYPLPPRRRITIEYTLVSEHNDSVAEARAVATLLRGLPVKINLIPMNPVEASTLRSPSWERVLAFQRTLCDAGYSCFIRRRRGDDVSAACGQLALAGEKPKVRVYRGPGAKAGT